MHFKVKRIREYIDSWKLKGYEHGIPDAVPNVLRKMNLAPSYKAIAIAILNNDHDFNSLGFTSKTSIYYGILKRIELERRNK